MSKIRIYTSDGACVEPSMIFHNGIWRAEAAGAVGWGSSPRQSAYSLCGQPPFADGVEEILEGDGDTKHKLLQDIRYQKSLAEDWRSHTPVAWEISEHAKMNPPQNLSLWDYRPTEDTAISRLVAVITTVNIRWRMVGAETYEITPRRGGFFRPSKMDGTPAPWPNRKYGE